MNMGGSDCIDQLSQQSALNNYNFIDEYIPESNKIDIEKLKQSPFLRKRRYVDALFFGDILEKQREGKGVMRYKSGRTYEGEWKGDLRHGQGFEKYQNGNVYTGSFDKGKAHGQGHYTWKATGEVYDGEWVRGVRQGYGMWKNKKGDSYLGEWQNGKAVGYGVFTWCNGDKYEGEWNMSLKHGKGSDYFQNGDNYRGEYKSGKPEGFGVYTWSNGSTYEGNFKNGLKFGKGKWRKAAESPGAPTNQYTGEYIDDKKCGQGEFRWGSGNVYSGEYKEDEREGHGEMMWTDGSKYIGQWIRGIQHGYGKMVFPDGTFKEGYFENNIYVGHVPSKKTSQQYQTPLKPQSQSSFIQRTGNAQSNQQLNHSGQKTLQQKLLSTPLAPIEQRRSNGGSHIIPSSKQVTAVMNRRRGSKGSAGRLSNNQDEQNQDDYHKSYNVFNKLSNGKQYTNKKDLSSSQSMLNLSNGFLSNQKLRNRLNSPQHFAQKNNQASQQKKGWAEQLRMRRNQSQGVLQSIKKPAYAKVQQTPTLQPHDPRSPGQKQPTQQEDFVSSNPGLRVGGSDSMNTGRNSSLDVTGQKGKKQKKYLAKSKKSTNSQSAKAIPLGIKATRFSDPSYYHNSQNYNLGLS